LEQIIADAARRATPVLHSSTESAQGRTVRLLNVDWRGRIESGRQKAETTTRVMHCSDFRGGD
jgi:hypothetical protein